VPGTGIRRKIWTVYVLQVAAISMATILGVYGAATVLEDVLIKRALSGEATYYWQRLERDPQVPVPDTNNMTGYLSRPGEDKTLVVLLIIYITTWLTYRASRRALSPVIILAKVVRDWDPKRPDLAAIDPRNLSSDPDGDVETLAGALHSFASRIEEFVERERNFTRDASHELRSPLTVIKIAADVLLEDELAPFAERTVMRIKRSVRDMEAMIEAFLILARESDTGLPEEDFVVNDAVREEIERAQPLLEGKQVTLTLDEQSAFALHAPPRVFAAMVSNLIRNACLYTEAGKVQVVVGADFVSVQDSGIGMSEDELAQAFQPYYRGNRSTRGGHGVGLTLVRRLSERFGWPIELHSRLGVGTTATIRFPRAARV
jgi:signal transduction histidine kinase